MNSTKILIPSAASILQSMRDIGYTLDTAVADIIDNSIAAAATKIDLIFSITPSPRFLIIDNGQGMDSDELYQALRFATKSPIEIREEKDLGRFGLGLKTASFSQARKLTVVSCKEGKMSAAQWDLDYVVQSDQWLLKIIDPSELSIDSMYLDQIAVHGTIVIWDDIDRIEFSENHTQAQNYLGYLLTKLREHLGLVFHKFIEGTAKTEKIKICLNHHEIEAFNPFCLSNQFTQLIGTEKILVDDSEVLLQAYTLPHYSKMNSAEYELFKKRSDLLNGQGAYVYRNDRLMVWGDWFRLIPKTENSKYARVEINFDKQIDHQWTIDIKKSKASPPYAVLEALRRIIGKITTASVRMSTKRVSKSLTTNQSPWNRFSGEEISYKLNTNFPLYQNFFNTLSSDQRIHFQSLVEIIQSSLPMQSIYSDMAVNPKQIAMFDQVDRQKTKQKFLRFAEFMQEENMTKDKLKDAAVTCGLFSQYINDLDQWVEEYYA